MWKRLASIVSVLAGVALASRASAQEAGDCSTRITRSNVVPCALTASLTVRGEQKTVDALQGRRTATGLFLPSNPVLSLSGGRRTVGGGIPDAINWYATLSQEIELAGQRASRVRAADAAIVAQEKRVLLSKRETAALAWSAFFEALGAREQQRLTERLLAMTDRMGVVARARAEKGVSATLDADLAEAATLRLLQLKLAADRSVAATGAHLTFLLGRDPSTGVVGVEGDLVPLSGLPDARAGVTSLAQRPEVQVADAERDAMLSRAEAFRRSRVPNPIVSVFVQNDGFNERVLGLGLAIPIPLPAPVGRTYAGEIAEADALAQRLEIERTRVERELRLEIADALATYTAHRLAVEALTPERMRRAEDSLRDLQVEIEAGRLGVREALVAQQTLIELLQASIAQRRALCLASVDLARALGIPLEGGAR